MRNNFLVIFSGSASRGRFFHFGGFSKNIFGLDKAILVLYKFFKSLRLIYNIIRMKKVKLSHYLKFKKQCFQSKRLGATDLATHVLTVM